jgi:hypothetical protein
MISMAMNDSENLSYFLESARGDIVENILSLCLTGARYDEFLEWTSTSSSTLLLKKYLFYPIEYDLLSYNGKNQVYMIKDRGLEVLSTILDYKTT